MTRNEALAMALIIGLCVFGAIACLGIALIPAY